MVRERLGCALLGLAFLLGAGCGGSASTDATVPAAGGQGTGGDLGEAGAAQSVGGGPALAELPHLDTYRASTETFSPPETCTAGLCADGQTCFPITDDFGICDSLVESTGCDSCDPSQFCGAFPSHDTGPMITNACVPRPCSSPNQCGADVCIPPSFIGAELSALARASQCAPITCHRDSDCTLAAGGRCAALLASPVQTFYSVLVRVTCLYPRSEVTLSSPGCKNAMESYHGITCD